MMLFPLAFTVLSTVALAGGDWPDAYSRSGDSAPQVAWWTVFDDEELTRVIEEAMSENRDLAAGWARVHASEIQSQNALAPIIPSVRFDVGGNVAPFNSLGFQFGGALGGFSSGFGTTGPTPLPQQFVGISKAQDPLVYYTGSALFRAQWNLDMGRTVMSHRAAAHDAAALEDDIDANRVQTAREVTRAYFDLIAAKQQVGIIKTQIETMASILDVTRARFEAGQATGVDVLQQQQQVAQFEAMLPQAEQQERLLERQIAVFAGRFDAPKVDAALRLPTVTAVAEMGSPEDLADGRPDVRAAKKRIDSAEARRWSAILSFLPTLGLTGQAGAQGTYFSEPAAQWIWGAGATLSLPLFTSGQNIQNLRLAAANQTVAEETLYQLRRRAVADVETAVLREEAAASQLAATRRQQQGAEETLQKSLARFEAGMIPFTQVLLAQNTAYSAELSVLQQQRQLVAARIDFLNALGGAYTSGGRP